jgi:hypothetical protein
MGIAKKSVFSEFQVELADLAKAISVPARVASKEIRGLVSGQYGRILYCNRK